MRAVTIQPSVPNSARLLDVPDPPPSEGAILVDALALGVCGTDHEIVAGHYGEAPPDHERLILGHESLGRVREAPTDSGFAIGDHIVGIVRQRDPVPCPACAAGEWDMCRNGQYTEHGIKGLNGFGAERFRIDPDYAVKVDKALGILGALIGQQRGLDVHVYDHNETGPKPELVRALGGTYHCGALDDLAALTPDVAIECTGVPDVIAALITHVAPDSVICLTGVGASHKSQFDIGMFNRNAVLNNGTVFGTVNANLHHYAM